MYFQQFYLGCLAHASYLVGSEGIAAVVDPQRDVEIYLEEALKNNLRIAYVIETHLHADFVSGHRELAARTGAEIYVGAKAGAQFAHHPVAQGDQINFGRCRLDFLETPGHTVESICVLLTDLDRSPEPFAVLTGDTLFIGDVGRPDLSPDHTPQQLAGLLYDSLHQKLLRLADGVEVYPAHGAGSLCGRQISAARSSTIGEQRITNYALRPSSREEFVQMLTAALPDRPAYFAQDAAINRTGATSLADLPPVPRLDLGEAVRCQEAGAVLLDTRPDADFAAGHVPGAINIPLSGQFASWAGALIGLQSDLVLVASDAERVAESRMRLARVGIERVVGSLEAADGLAHEQLPQISVRDLERLRRENAELQVADVRRPGEWEDGHIQGAVLLPLNQASAMLAELDRARPVAVHCKSGYRSAIACSLLQRAGFRQVMNVTGGFDAWKAAFQ